MTQGPCSSQDLENYIHNLFEQEVEYLNDAISRFLEKLLEADLVLDTHPNNNDVSVHVDQSEKPIMYTYEPPEMVRFGNLETLILSAE